MREKARKKDDDRDQKRDVKREKERERKTRLVLCASLHVYGVVDIHFARLALLVCDNTFLPNVGGLTTSEPIIIHGIFTDNQRTERRFVSFYEKKSGREIIKQRT